MAIPPVNCVADLERDVRAMSPETAAWIRQSYWMWPSQCDPRELLANSGQAGTEALKRIDAWRLAYGPALGSPLTPTTVDDLWLAITAMAATFIVPLSEDEVLTMERPFEAGRMISAWSQSLHPNAVEVAQSICGPIRGSGTSPVRFMIAVQELSEDLDA
jgi:hypothetical protein